MGAWTGRRAQGRRGEVKIYDAGHAFFNDTRPEAYEPSHARDAWQRVLDFSRATCAGARRRGMTGEQVAIITGASSGIGRAAALALAGRLLVSACSRAGAPGRGGRGGAEAAEVSRRPATCAMRPRSGGRSRRRSAVSGSLDVLINSAGLSLNGEVDGYALADWRTVLETNLTGTFLACRAVLPAMKEQGGQIINISSGAGRNGIQGMAAYCAAKFGVIGFTEALGSKSAATTSASRSCSPARWRPTSRAHQTRGAWV